MAKKKNKKTPSTPKSIHNKIILTGPQRSGSIVLGLFIIIAFSWIIIHYAQSIATLRRVTQARTSNESTYDSKRFKRIDALRSGGLINSTAPVYSSKIDACYVTHADQGWVAADWYQDCYIRYTDLFPISLSRSNLEQKLQATNGISDLFGKPNSFQPRICDALYESNYQPTLIYLDLTLDAKDMGLDCKIPKPTQDTFTVRGPILLDDQLAVKSERSYDPSSVDKTKKYLYMQSDNYYYHESLGCGVGLLCPSPRKNPITGF